MKFFKTVEIKEDYQKMAFILKQHGLNKGKDILFSLRDIRKATDLDFDILSNSESYQLKINASHQSLFFRDKEYSLDEIQCALTYILFDKNNCEKEKENLIYNARVKEAIGEIDLAKIDELIYYLNDKI